MSELAGSFEDPALVLWHEKDKAAAAQGEDRHQRPQEADYDSLYKNPLNEETNHINQSYLLPICNQGV